MRHRERHRTERIGWLRAAALGANDGIVSTASLMVGISEIVSARPLQAALASAVTFAVGAALPLLVAVFSPERALGHLVAGSSLAFLALLGGLAAQAGGAPLAVGGARVTFWGALAMGLTAGVGALFGTIV
jgi:VIT1/CCC1 family predicted Fe2+/Mn2+ transporter